MIESRDFEGDFEDEGIFELLGDFCTLQNQIQLNQEPNFLYQVHKEKVSTLIMILDQGMRDELTGQ